METSYHEDEKMRVLYEASYKGCVSILNTLIQQDPLILHKINSRTIVSETPLHISALLGHLEFTKTLLAHCPKLTLDLDSFRSTPLHLASAEGHINIVKELLQACGEACLGCDQEHRIPLHYAVIRGRRDIVLELIRANPESLTLHDDKGKNVLHLCVMYNHLEILKDLVALDTDDTNKLLIEGDSDGNNTILHLAITLKQVETVSYLVSIPKIKSGGLNLKNDMGYSAADVVYRIPMDSKCLEMQVILMESGIKCGGKERIGVACEEDRHGKKKWSWRKVFKLIDKWLLYNAKRLKDMRGNLCTVATVISTISFQAAFNPPESIIQKGTRPSDPDFNLTSNSNLDVFIRFNTISFCSSLSVALMVVSGVPLKNRFVVWMISLGMNNAVMYLIYAYYVALNLISPNTLHAAATIIMFMITWISMVFHALAGAYIEVKFFIWVVKKSKGNLIKVKKLMKEKLTKHPSDQGIGPDMANA